MTGEQFLISLRHLDDYINSLDVAWGKLLDPRQDIIDQAHPSSGLTGINVQHGVSSKTENLGIRLADLPVDADRRARLKDLSDKINRKIDELVDKRERALMVIDLIPDNRYKMLLLNRYVNNLKWSTIADLMGYTQPWVETDLRRAAIAAYEEAEKTTM